MTERAKVARMEQTAEEAFHRALRHLDRVLSAWDDPTDWTMLSFFGFYCLENCVVAAALHIGEPIQRHHAAKEKTARRLSKTHGLPDIGDLLIDLNEMRKHEAYGDINPPEGLEPENTAAAIEGYVESMRRFLTR